MFPLKNLFFACKKSLQEEICQIWASSEGGLLSSGAEFLASKSNHISDQLQRRPLPKALLLSGILWMKSLIVPIPIFAAGTGLGSSSCYSISKNVSGLRKFPLWAGVLHRQTEEQKNGASAVCSKFHPKILKCVPPNAENDRDRRWDLDLFLWSVD